jgi:hypothetical protein
MVVALLALAIALSGTAYAATTIGTNQIKDGAVTTPKLHNGAVSAAKLSNGAVAGEKIRNNAVTSGKVKDGSLLARDFKPGELLGGSVQGAQGPQGPQGPAGAQGPAGPQGPPGPGTAVTLTMPSEENMGGGASTIYPVFTIGHARLEAWCVWTSGAVDMALTVTAVGGEISVAGTNIPEGSLPLAPGELALLSAHGAGITDSGHFAVLDDAGPSFSGTFGTYVKTSSNGPCIVTAQAAPTGESP